MFTLNINKSLYDSFVIVADYCARYIASYNLADVTDDVRHFHEGLAERTSVGVFDGSRVRRQNTMIFA